MDEYAEKFALVLIPPKIKQECIFLGSLVKWFEVRFRGAAGRVLLRACSFYVPRKNSAPLKWHHAVIVSPKISLEHACRSGNKLAFDLSLINILQKQDTLNELLTSQSYTPDVNFWLVQYGAGLLSCGSLESQIENPRFPVDITDDHFLMIALDSRLDWDACNPLESALVHCNVEVVKRIAAHPKARLNVAEDSETAIERVYNCCIGGYRGAYLDPHSRFCRSDNLRFALTLPYVDINEPIKAEGYYEGHILSLAIRNYDVEAIQIILECPFWVDINLKDNIGRTPLLITDTVRRNLKLAIKTGGRDRPLPAPLPTGVTPESIYAARVEKAAEKLPKIEAIIKMIEGRVHKRFLF
jgi:hypothetical protein